jgi:hypothetical protein
MEAHVIAMLCAGLLLLVAGLTEKRFVWKAKPAPMPRRRRRA